MDDGEIVALYLARDESAIDETQAKYGRRLEQLSKRIVGDHGTAEECVNDAYMRTWNAIPPHEPGNYFFAFIAKITREISLNRYKMSHAQKRQAQLTILSGELEECLAGTDTVEQRIDEGLLKECINQFLSEQEKEKRIIFLRRYWYMDEISEIAGQYGYSVEKVKSMLFRLRKKLRKRLESEGFMDGRGR